MKKERITKLSNWSLGFLFDNPYLPPEANPPVLYGKVSNHPKKADGSYVRTSGIVKTDGVFVTTISGTKYELCNIEPEYLNWIKRNNCNFDAKNPVRLKK